jgi:hypothetical protein
LPENLAGDLLEELKQNSGQVFSINATDFPGRVRERGGRCGTFSDRLLTDLLMYRAFSFLFF